VFSVIRTVSVPLGIATPWVEVGFLHRTALYLRQPASRQICHPLFGDLIVICPHGRRPSGAGVQDSRLPRDRLRHAEAFARIQHDLLLVLNGIRAAASGGRWQNSRAREFERDRRQLAVQFPI
jgi:hypothetical protein